MVHMKSVSGDPLGMDPKERDIEGNVVTQTIYGYALARQCGI